MTPKLCCFHIARFVLQAETAFAVNSGLRDGAFDSLIVRDANELPAIPGTSLAGVLRHQFESLYGNQVQAVFGYAKKDQGEASRLHVSWGCVHDSHDRPVEGIRFDLNKDPILERLQQDHPFHRERVCINERGVAQDGSKFDLTVVPAGCRFSFEISYWSDSKDDPHWRNILTLLYLPLQIGASTRSGLGWFKLERLAQRSLDLKNQEDWDRYKRIGFSLADTAQLDSGFQMNSSLELIQAPIQATLKLEAEDFWRFGQTGEPLNKAGKTPDATPLIEPVIAWKDNKAYFTPKQVVVPASGVKGALWHRVQFHYECLKWDEDAAAQGNEDEAANILFGFANNKQQGKESAGQAGLILFKDVYLQNVDAAHLTHNGIDRFTGGVRDKVLFTEEVIWRQEFNLTLQIDPVRLGYLEKDETKKQQLALYKKALKRALNDLIEGRLALGAGSAKGHGYFSGSIAWTDNGNWIGAGDD